MRRIAIALLCLLPISLHAEDRTIATDSTFWKGLTHKEKIFFVEGYALGFASGAIDMGILREPHVATSRLRLNELKNDPHDLMFGTVVEGVDKCYEDFRNARLDVSLCIDWTVRGVRGDSDAERERHLARARKSDTPDGQ
jgi:hypothetical protein